MLDDDGFAIRDESPKVSAIRPPPPMVEMPKFFDGCRDADEAVGKMINELGKPYSVQLHGADEGFHRIFTALTLILAKLGGLTP